MCYFVQLLWIFGAKIVMDRSPKAMRLDWPPLEHVNAAVSPFWRLRSTAVTRIHLITMNITPFCAKYSSKANEKKHLFLPIPKQIPAILIKEISQEIQTRPPLDQWGDAGIQITTQRSLTEMIGCSLFNYFKCQNV